MKALKCLSVAIMLIALSSVGFSDEGYTPDWESLKKHKPAPEWLKDAKLGIYFHWGVYSVPAFGSEWYPCRMHDKTNRCYQHHIEKYGDPSKFGYHDFVPMFKAEHFDPEAWADLFQKTGARFAGPVAEHHDGYSMWASKVTPWNAKDTGPKRDILGELFTALRKRDLKTIATFHHARNHQRNKGTGKGLRPEGYGHYKHIKGWPTSSEEPQLRLLYGNVPAEEWHEKIWLGKLIEVVDNYQPDIIWFDSWLSSIPEGYRQRFCAYYLNKARKWGKDVAIVRKQNDLPIEFTINDHEKSREPRALPELWMTDDTISKGSWCYTQDLKIKPATMIIHAFIDTVSKNGVTLLNISPKANGEIPQDQRKVLLELGAWLKQNGEAMYDTRPWTIAAEGPTAEPEGGLKNAGKFMNLKYSAKDIRYTTSKDGKTVYATLLGVPQAGATVMLTAIASTKVTPKSIQLLSGGKVEWTVNSKGAEIKLPADFEQPDNTFSCTFKIGL